MTTQTVAASEEAGQPDPFTAIADELHRVAYDIATLAGIGLTAPRQFQLNIQPGGTDDDTVARNVDALAEVIAGKPGGPELMLDGEYFYSNCNNRRRGPFEIAIYREVSTEWVERRAAAIALADREAELVKLRAEVDQLRAQVATDASGLGYSREADDPTPVSPARVPMHTGGVVDGGQLVTDDVDRCVASLHISTPGESCLVCGAEGMRHGQHIEVMAGSTDMGVSSQCACGFEVDGFDSFAEARAELVIHIRDAGGCE